MERKKDCIILRPIYAAAMKKDFDGSGTFFIKPIGMILQCGVLFAFLALGELTVMLTGVPVPSSILGMLALTLALRLGIVKLSMVERVSDFLVHNLGFFFIPAGVGLMRCLDIISAQWLPIIGASVGSTVVIIAVTGRVHQWIRRNRIMNHRKMRSLGEGGQS